jgi:catechol 2,3-dioxygenase-like lactoylglutathione lyase family enzyme
MAGFEALAAIPVLPALDIEKGIAFYRDKLGFSLAFQYPDYAGLKLGAVEVHLWRCEDPALPGMTSCRIHVRGVDALYEQAKQQGVVHPNGPLEDKPWGLRQFTALDLWGNAIVFAEPSQAGA